MAETTKPSKGFSADEKAAMRERAKELKAESRSKADRADGERDLLAKIAEMPPADRDMAERLHKLITATAPHLTPKTWYGMPAYAIDADEGRALLSADEKRIGELVKKAAS